MLCVCFIFYFIDKKANRLCVSCVVGVSLNCFRHVSYLYIVRNSYFVLSEIVGNLFVCLFVYEEFCVSPS